MGPTATGKTDLAVALAQRLPVALISVDSALVYRGMDIGTAKPSPALRARHPHALVDIRDPAEPYSAAEFRSDALAALDAARAAGRLPVLVGGTMLYFRVLEAGIAELPPADPALRAELAARLEVEGPAALHAELARVDPEAAARIDPGNPQRIQRALEVFRASGRPLSWWWAREATGRPLETDYALHRFALLPGDRAALHAAVAARFEAMLAAGFLDEVRALRARGDLSPALPSMRAVGYRQAWAHLEGAFDAAELRDRAVAATRQLARRQLTWLRRWEGVHRIEVTPGTEPGEAQLAPLLDALRSRAPGGPAAPPESS
jgi:tRNA dimethylallyltransferase